MKIDPSRSRFNSGHTPSLPLSHSYERRAAIERLCSHLCQLGPRAVAEFLSALSLEHGLGNEITAKLQEYWEIDAETLKAVGGYRFAHTPTREIGR